MSTEIHPLERLEFTSRVRKRAQYEAFAFTIAGDGVRVRNESHANPAEHEYHVTVVNGVPTSCTCPADEHFDGACKHRVAVAIRTPVLVAATRNDTNAGKPLVTDGGFQTELTSEMLESDEDEECDCDELAGEFPCWECVRTGKRKLPN